MLSRISATQQIQIKSLSIITGFQMATLLLTDPCADFIANLASTDECSVMTKNIVATIFIAADLFLTAKTTLNAADDIHWASPRPHWQFFGARPQQQALARPEPYTHIPRCLHHAN